MSTLIETLKNDMIEARKSRDKETVKILTTLWGEIELLAKKQNVEISEELVTSTVKKFIVNTEKFNLMDLPKEIMDTISHERDVLNKYLPSQMSEDMIRSLLSIENPSDIGKAMKYLKDNFAGQYDGKLASEIAKEIINGR